MWDGSAWALEANPAADATSYKDEDLAPGTRYHYILSAINMHRLRSVVGRRFGMTAAGAPDAPMLTATATGPTRSSSPGRSRTPTATITGYELQKWE